MSDTLPFPWSDGEGLCPVLSSDSLWAIVFPDSNDRHAIKKAAKARGAGRIVKTDDSAIGQTVIRLLRSRSGRRQLGHELASRKVDEWRGTLASALYTRYVVKKLGNLPSEGEVCDYRSDSPAHMRKPFLNSTKFALWLERTELNSEAVRPIALFASAFAILQSDIGPTIYRMLMDRDPAFAPLVGIPAPQLTSPSVSTASDTINTSSAPASPKTKKPVPAELLKEKSSSEAVVADQLTQLEQSIADLDFYMRPDQLAKAAKLLVRLGESYMRHCQKLLETQERLRRHLGDIARLPWLKRPPTVISVGPLEATRVQQERLANQDRDAERVLQTHHQLTALFERLDESPVAFVPAETSLTDVSEWLKRRADDCQERLQEISRREQAVKEFLDGFLNATSEASITLLQDADDTRWIDLAGFVLGPAPLTDLGKSCFPLVGKVTLLGIAFVAIWPQKPELTCQLLEMAVRALPTGAGEPLNEVFCWSPVALLHDVAALQPDLVPSVSQYLFASAVGSDQPADLEYLAPLLDASTLDGSCARLYQSALEMFRRRVFTEPSRQLAEATQENPPAAPDPSRGERFRQELVDFARLSPRMGPRYYKLRKLVQRNYLEPLVPDIQADAPAEVRRRWAQYGGLKRMVDECVTESGLRLDHSHLEETRKYLEHFENRLVRWETSRLRTPPAENRGLRLAVQSLEQAAGQGIAQAVGLLGTIRRLSVEGAAPFSSDRRCVIQGDVPVLVHPETAITPDMTRSWPAFLREEPVQVLNLFADLLQQTIAPLTLPQVVEDYLRREEFQAARRAADGDEILCARVAAELARCRKQVRVRFADLLRRAKQVRARDEYIPLCLDEIDEALENLNFDVVEPRFAELAGMVRRQEMLADPLRQALLLILHEAGELLEEELPLEVLQKRAEQLRRKNQDRRLHLEELARCREAESLPTGLGDRLADLGRRTDRPSLWPDAELSLEIAAPLEHIFRFITGRFRGGQVDQSARVGDWLCTQWQRATEGNFEERPLGRQALADMARAIAEYYPESRILELLGPAPSVTVRPLSPPEEIPTVVPATEKKTEVVADHSSSSVLADGQTGSTETTVGITRVFDFGAAPILSPSGSTETTADITARLRHYLREQAEQELPPDPPPAEAGRALRTATRAWQWKTARPLAAALVLNGPTEGPLCPVEAALAVALVRTTAAGNPEAMRLAYQHACLSVLLAWEPQPDLLREEVRNFVLARAVAQMHRPVPPDDEAAPELAEHLRSALEVWTDLPVADPALRDVGRLFQEAGFSVCPDGKPAVFRLADILWEAVKKLDSAKAVSRARGDLLKLLHRLRQLEALRHLAGQSSQLGDLLISCLSAFDQAESNPTLFTEAGIYAAAYRDQAAGKKNYSYGPWLQLFDSLEAAAGRDELPLACEPVSEFVAREEDGGATLQVRVAPSRTDRPSTLTIELGTTATGSRPYNLLGDEEALLKEKVLDLPLSPLLVATAGEALRIPYRLTGQTIRRRPIDLRGTWEVPFSSQVMEPLSEDDILTAWPGADGSPVRSNRGFHGREVQMQKIEKLLCDSHRPLSIMLIGERRIGKTSLLWEMVGAQPPSKERICGAFLDAAGLNLKEKGSMARLFFNFVVRYLLQEDANRHLQDALRQHGGIKAARALARPEWLAEKFAPDDSLKIALEQLTDWLHEQTDQRVPRLALFVDEFDKFVEPLLTGHAADVNKLMWGLREVVQRSARVALVLAGSGLLKLFVQGLDKPLHQSIFELELEAFNRSDTRDWQAIGDTFLPTAVRKRLCPERPVEVLLDHAAALCGSHPYYLAMLGYAAAIESHGHALTPAVLNRVVERMIQGKVLATRIAITSDKFYTPLFVSLDRLEPRPKAIAKALLVTLARRTTAELPELPKWHLAEAPHADPELTDLTTEEERWQAYGVLLMERAFQEDEGKSRIRLRVPLTAAALRHDAVEIRYAALKTLRATKGKGI